MRFTLRIMALILVLLALLVPLTASADCRGPCPHASCGPCPYASCAPCPDDPELSKTCDQCTPPFYVVANRTFDRLGPQYGTGCQPWILKNPDCKGWASTPAACEAAANDVEMRICGYEMPNAGAVDGDILWELYCDDGHWMHRQRILHENPAGFWECPDPGPWEEYLPPGTGIDLPAPVIIGGLAVIGAGLLAAGVLVRRRTVQAA